MFTAHLSPIHVITTPRSVTDTLKMRLDLYTWTLFRIVEFVVFFFLFFQLFSPGVARSFENSSVGCKGYGVIQFLAMKAGFFWMVSPPLLLDHVFFLN